MRSDADSGEQECSFTDISFVTLCILSEAINISISSSVVGESVIGLLFIRDDRSQNLS